MATQLQGLRRPPDRYADEEEHRGIISRALFYTMRRGEESFPKDGTERMDGPLPLALYTENTPSDTRPPAADHEGDLLYTTDTKTVFYSNGTVWLPMSVTISSYVGSNADMTPGTAQTWTRAQGWTLKDAANDPLGIWDQANQRWDLSLLPIPPRGLRSPIKMFLSNSVNQTEGGAAGAGINGANPVVSSPNWDLYSASAVAPSNRSPIATIGYNPPMWYTADLAVTVNTLECWVYSGASGVTFPQSDVSVWELELLL